jgi:SAM-dependent methyltransferase
MSGAAPGGAAQAYWDANAEAHACTHPLDPGLLAELPKSARILDYGCGYGRIAAELAAAGWRNVVGVDFAPAMIDRGRREHPGLDPRDNERLPLAEPDGAFDAALLIAVLTTIPGDDDQQAVMAELRRLIRPGGLLYVSDCLLQSDARHLARYAAGQQRHGVWGVWDRDDGGVFRHHSRARLQALMQGFETVAECEFEARTLGGGAITAIRLLARRVA